MPHVCLFVLSLLADRQLPEGHVGGDHEECDQEQLQGRGQGMVQPAREQHGDVSVLFCYNETSKFVMTEYIRNTHAYTCIQMFTHAHTHTQIRVLQAQEVPEPNKVHDGGHTALPSGGVHPAPGVIRVRRVCTGAFFLYHFSYSLLHALTLLSSGSSFHFCLLVCSVCALCV